MFPMKKLLLIILPIVFLFSCGKNVVNEDQSSSLFPKIYSLWKTTPLPGYSPVTYSYTGLFDNKGAPSWIGYQNGYPVKVMSIQKGTFEFVGDSIRFYTNSYVSMPVSNEDDLYINIKKAYNQSPDLVFISIDQPVVKTWKVALVNDTLIIQNSKHVRVASQ
jgi:hypothetical protein